MDEHWHFDHRAATLDPTIAHGDGQFWSDNRNGGPQRAEFPGNCRQRYATVAQRAGGTVAALFLKNDCCIKPSRRLGEGLEQQWR